MTYQRGQMRAAAGEIVAGPVVYVLDNALAVAAGGRDMGVPVLAELGGPLDDDNIDILHKRAIWEAADESAGALIEPGREDLVYVVTRLREVLTREAQPVVAASVEVEHPTLSGGLAVG